MNRPRVHYTPDCPNTSGNDTLATSTADYPRVNCEDCVHEMYDVGIYQEATR